MEAALRAALRYGLSEADFWGMTPYRVALHVQEVAAGQRETAFLAGWSAEFSARQQTLSGPQVYIEQLFGAQSEDVSEAQAEAELTRWAMGWGLEVEEVDGE